MGKEGNNEFKGSIKGMKNLLMLLLMSIGCFGMHAQDSIWTLDRSIQYAVDNNISIQQSEINERVAKLQWQQSKLSQLPNLSLSSSYGRSFGRSINPTSNQFESSSYDYTGLNGSGDVLLFGWFQKRNTIVKNELLRQAAEAESDQLKDNVILNVTTGYLRALLAKEQVNISKNQLSLSKQKVEETDQLLKAGRSNGLDLAQMKTQLITDSTTYFKAELEYQQAIIDIKALLNLDFETPFSTDSDLEEMDLEPLFTLNPKMIYKIALTHLGKVKSSALKVEGAKSEVKIAKSSLFPTLNLSASSGTNYSSTFFQTLPNGDLQLMPWGKQLQNNLAQSVSIGLSIPIFNGLASRIGIKQAQFALQNSKLDEMAENSALEGEIYKTWNDAQTAFQTYYASKSAAETAELGHYFAEERYAKGLINAADFLTAQNSSFRAQSEEASAKYDLIFKLKLINYYLGKD